MKYIFSILIFSSLFFAGFSQVALAETTSAKTSTGGSSVALTNPLGEGTTLVTIISRLIKAFLGLVGALALGVFVYAGIFWMTAGSSDRVTKAKDTMKYAIIGLAMITFSYTISSFLLKAFLSAKSETKPTAEVEINEAVELK